MKYAWDYVKEDIVKEKARERKKAFEGGILQKSYDLIKRMLQNGESMDKIKLYSGFSTKEIEKIRKELNLAV